MKDPAISLRVFGDPVPKGSKSAFPIRKGGVLTGRVAVVEGKTKRQSEWRARVLAAAQGAAESGAPMLDGPIALAARFRLRRPVSEPKRHRTWPVRKPDLDKLLRGLLDPLTGVLIADDARIVAIEAAKDWVAPDEQPGVEVELYQVSEGVEP